MKKFISSIVCFTIIFILSVNVSASTTLKEFKVKIVDKNDVAIQNALITVSPIYKPKETDYRYFTTDANGEFRIPGGDSGIFSGEYNIIVKIPTLYKYQTQTIKYKFTTQNTKKTITIKSTLENQNQVLFKAENRTDIYLRNSKGGAVRNMKIQLAPTFDIPQSAYPYGTNTHVPFAYTNSSGRVTFVSPTKGEYVVEYSWLGGKSSGGKINITEDKGVTEFVLDFDETLLEPK